MAGRDAESSHANVGRWGDDEGRDHRRELRHHHHDGRRRFDMYRFLQIGPKPLVGGESVEVAEGFLERVESCFRVFNTTEEQRLEALNFLLEGRARRWWKSVSTPLLKERGTITWADFRTAFEKLYFNPVIRQIKSLELLSLKQGNMSVDEYQQKFSELLPYCPHIHSSSKAKCVHFLHGLKQEIFERVSVCDDPTPSLELLSLKQRNMSVDEYHQKFSELLPYSPHIHSSSEAKYVHFLHGLNQEIFERVSVCNDPTSYEGLVNCCRQAEISLQRGRTLNSARPSGNLGPQAQSFKKSSFSTTSFGSGGVHRFGKKKGQNHLTHMCRKAAGAWSLFPLW
ncbi:uncharacterized protein [Henckelia pumila]|uniref:uncharacterized protein n=1 Tax=Henckelia pumila TaxID=405737 RepID=UPI003C6E5E03